jgi:hypothetical protein
LAVRGGYMKRWAFAIGCVAVFAMACSGRGVSPTAPTVGSDRASAMAAGGSSQSPAAEEPPFNLEAILRGDGFGLVKFRQEQDPTHNIVTLDVWVRDLLADSSYSLQRAVDTTLDGVCTGTNWLTLGDGLTPHPIVTDGTGTARAALSRDLSALAAGTTFDIYFRVIENGTSHVALQSECYRFVVRD